MNRPLHFERLSSGHDRQNFDCGNDRINRFLRETARQQGERELSATMVCVPTAESPEIIGFHTLVMHQVMSEAIPARGLPRERPVPVILLAQFGVDLRHQGDGYGKAILYHALLLTMQAADRVGCYAMVLDAIDEGARQFYLKRGFSELRDDPNHLWLPIRKIRALFTAAEADLEQRNP